MVVRDPIGFFDRNREAFGPVFRARFVSVPRIVYVARPRSPTRFSGPTGTSAKRVRRARISSSR
jgi:hypothetical protein